MINLDLRPIFYLAAFGFFVGVPVALCGVCWLLYHLVCAVYYYVTM